MTSESCPCSSGMPYEQCCKPFHNGKSPQTAVQLTRARYAAYVLDIPDYIIKTTHPSSPQYSPDTKHWKESISEFSRFTTFQKLEVLDAQELESVATITFVAYMQQDGHDATFTEKSHFEKVKGSWLYRGGQLADGHAPHLISTGQLKLLPLAYYGDAVLRKKAEPVTAITGDIKKLVEEMIETMDACDGVGLAAPQVHHSIQLFVIRIPKENSKRELVALGEPKVFINPKLSSPSKETWTETEGCLSVPTLRANVERPLAITVTYTTLDGDEVAETVSGWEARVIMHENDHLRGTFFLDRASNSDKKLIQLQLDILKKRIHDGTEL